jgi:Tol biopolymer transport system component
VADDGSFICSDGGRGALYDMLLASRDKSLTLVPGGPFRGLYAPALSPDGTRIAYSGVTDDNRDIWVLDLERGTRLRLTSDPGNDDEPRWSADGREIFFERWIPGASSLYRVGATGDPPPAPVAEYVSWAAPLPDGRALLCERDNEELGDSDIVRCALEPEAQPVPLLHSRFNEDQPAVSPDGRWLAYRSDETGRGEIFLYDLSGRGTKLQVSLDGGELPMWGPRGETLCYLRGGEWMEVRLTPGDDPAPKRPERIFTAADLGLAIGHDVAASVGLGMSPDGERFLVIRRSSADPRSGILYFRRFEPSAR